ncbi:MAG: zinc ribbon domain-containing protein [Halovenus sp.]
MSKITFRADDELITRLEEFDASKSEVMREALREYLDAHASESFTPSESDDGSLDELVADRVDELIADRLEPSFTPRQPQDVNVNITLDGDSAREPTTQTERVNEETAPSHTTSNEPSHGVEERKTTEVDGEETDPKERKTCTQCGEDLSPSHVYCPNCGEKASHRVFCECGDELRSDWAFCPGCGRRTPAADVLDQA